MKTDKKVKVLNVTYINPHYEPGKTVRTITDTIGVITKPGREAEIEARRLAKKMMDDQGITRYGVIIRLVREF